MKWITGERKNGEKIDKDRRIEESKAAAHNGDREKQFKSEWLKVNKWFDNYMKKKQMTSGKNATLEKN